MSSDFNLDEIILNNNKDGEQIFGLQKPTYVDSKEEKKLFEHSDNFIKFLKENHVSFLVSSYKTAQVYAIGMVNDPRDGEDKISVWMSKFNRPMGIHTSKKTVWISSSGNLWKYENQGSKPDTINNVGDFDASYLPQKAYFSNDIDAHDICIDKDGNPFYCSATFCCICQPSETHSFKVYKKPFWISKVTPEDRCHLNGVCARDGIPRYATAVCMGDAKGSWRMNRVGKGVVYDLETGKVVCEGLSMPHSPRWYDGKLWILEAGTGWIGYVDFEKKELKQVIWVPGYLRGCCFVRDKYMVVGSSEDRHENTFKGLPLGEELKKRGLEAICGFFVINMEKWEVENHLQFFSPANELYDVCVLEDITRPQILDVNDIEAKKGYKLVEKD